MSNQGAQKDLGRQCRSRRIVIEVLVVVAAGLLFGSLLACVVVPDPQSLHACAILAGVLAGVVIPVGAGFSVLRRKPVFLTLADRVTLGRGVLAGGCATLAVFIWAGFLPSQSWLLVLLAAPAALLDAVDGWVAMRTQSANAYGARLDMETDAAFLLILSIPAVLIVGPWVLVIGAMRYLFVVAAWWRPALKRKLRFSHVRRLVAAFQSAALVIVIAPITPLPAASILAGLALVLLTLSFGKDVYTLERKHKSTTLNRTDPRHPMLSRKQKVRQWFGHLLALAVAIEFVTAAIQKFLGSPAAIAPFAEFGWPIWFAYVVAVVEVLGAFLLLLPKSRVIGALLLAVVMIGATITNLANGHPDYVWLNALLFAATSLLALQRAHSRSTVSRNLPGCTPTLEP